MLSVTMEAAFGPMERFLEAPRLAVPRMLSGAMEPASGFFTYLQTWGPQVQAMPSGALEPASGPVPHLLTPHLTHSTATHKRYLIPS